MNSGKMLKISNERTIYILENENGEYIDENMLIRYRNIGANFEIKLINESSCSIEPNGMLNVLDNAGKSKFHFPAVWLDTNRMKLQTLVEQGIIKLN